MIIWGNHSSTQYPDLTACTVNGKPALDLVDRDWYENTYIPEVQQRGAAIIKARGASSAASAANAAIAHVRTWVTGTEDNDWVSMGVYSNGEYGISEGLIYSFPCTCKTATGLSLLTLMCHQTSKEKMAATEQELSEERDAVSHLLP